MMGPDERQCVWRIREHYHEILRDGAGASAEIVCERLAKELTHLPLSVLTFLDTRARKELDELSVTELESMSSLLRSRHGWALLCIASITKNGRLREWCVHWMDSHPSPEMLPFLILRLNDWVAPIRELAKKVAARQMVPEWANAYFECLPMIRRLNKLGRRDHGPFIRSAINFLRSPELEDFRERLLSSPDADVRREVFRLSIDADPHRAAERITNVIGSRDVLIKRFAFQCFWERAELQKSPLLEMFLLDLNLVHRQQTQLIGRKQNMPLAGFYRSVIDRVLESGGQLVIDGIELPVVLLENPKGTLRAALYGLGEVGKKGDVDAVLPFLSHQNTFIRRAAISATAWLDLEEHVGAIIAKLADTSHRVSNDAARTLIRNAHLILEHEAELQSLPDSGHCRENVEFVLQSGADYRKAWG